MNKLWHDQGFYHCYLSAPTFWCFFLFHCDYYNVKDLKLSSQFYNEMLQWWVDFQDSFSAEKPWHNIIWNDKDIHINDRPVFVKTFF